MRIWVARPEPGASRTAQHVHARGHTALVAPIFTVLAKPEAMPEGRFDAVLVTSGQAVRPLAETGAARDLTVFAVGRRTAEAARAAGLTRVESAEGDAADLSCFVRARLPPGARLLHAAGEAHKDEPAASLRRAGYLLDVWEAYEARPVRALPSEVATALAEGALAAALHYSRRGAATSVRLAQSAGLGDAFRQILHYCLSADVALPLVEAGVPAHFVAARPNENALLDGLPSQV